MLVTDPADKLIERLGTACKRAGLTGEVLEPSTKMKINTPDGNVRMAETVTLAPNADEVLMWWWSWGKPICPADQIDRAVDLISNVVAVRVF